MNTYTLDGVSLTPENHAALTKEGIVAPTAVQEAAAKPILAGNDVVIQSGTGTGKTLAYLLPLMQRLKDTPKSRVLIIAPTPELAVQILRVAEAFKPAGVLSAGLIGGGNADRQKDKLKKHPAIMVGTPGRVLDFIGTKKIKLPTLTTLVLDETDEILATQHRENLLDVCTDPTLTAQCICASATQGPLMAAFIAQCVAEDVVRVQGGGATLSTAIRHWSATYDATRKEVALMTLLRAHRIKQALVFVNKRSNVPHLYAFLNDHEIPTAGLSAERGKGSREQALQGFKKGQVRLLVATDAAARGIDIKALPWVIHYEPARDAETYVHRAGRTGRAGATGDSLTLIAPNEAHLLRRYTKDLGITFKHLADKEDAPGKTRR
jgi:ATP-dependent RNA helicase DeaD